ncbi:MAG: DUF4214 domain-containing protein [Parasphingopyxis sp.]|uniref:DUF4214 domain-containing protein n=1 Tax=Parasphingopyxis sp. TaxID=1920299 RepID=UPI003FA0B4A5
MRKLLKHSLMLAAASVSATLASAPADAVSRPGAIAWGAAPADFVTSLYNGVLGRAPESPAVVAAWAAQVTSDPRSRLDVLSRFMTSDEYIRRYGRPGGTWGIYWQASGNTVRWRASASSGGWHARRTGISQGYARALVGYYNTYQSRR